LPIVAEPLCRQRPFNPQTRRDHRWKHLGLGPDLVVPAPIAAAAPGEETTIDDGIASVTHLPIRVGKEHDGDEGEYRGAAAPEVDRGARPRTDGELEDREDAEDLSRQVPGGFEVVTVRGRATSAGRAHGRAVEATIVSGYPARACASGARA
jgi:hypothetical protein